MAEKRMAGFGPGGGWVLSPPVSRDEAERESGMEIPEAAWREICKAFALYGRRLDALEGYRGNRDKNDPLSFATQKANAERRMATAAAELDAIPRGFLDAAADTVSIAKTGGRDTFAIRARLGAVLAELDNLATLIRDAEAFPRETPTKAGAREQLARDVFAIMQPYGGGLSNGWRMADAAPAFADLSPFERLIQVLAIHDGAPRTTVYWLRETAKVGKRGR